MRTLLLLLLLTACDPCGDPAPCRHVISVEDLDGRGLPYTATFTPLSGAPTNWSCLGGEDDCAPDNTYTVTGAGTLTVTTADGRTLTQSLGGDASDDTCDCAEPITRTITFA